MRISELSRLSGASPRSIRHYEAQGLLSARRLPNGYREYAREAVPTVQRIRWLLAAGLPTRHIRALLPCVVDASPRLIACPALRQTLRSELDRIQTQIRSLEHSSSLLRIALAAADRVTSQEQR